MSQQDVVGAQNISQLNTSRAILEAAFARVPGQLVRSPSALDTQKRFARGQIRRRVQGEKQYPEKRQMFEILTSLERRSADGSDVSCTSAITMATSAGSASTDPWSSSGFVEEEGGAEFNWDEDNEALLVPKVEPIEDDMVEQDIAEYDPASTVKDDAVPQNPSDATTTVKTKRGRGRPRIHPKPTPESLAKVAKGRSKTGCGTCRKRKKKCDETKPSCLNCEKNSVVCEGYPPKGIWKSGTEKAEEARRQRRAGSITLSTIKLPYLINAIETKGDRVLFGHYVSRLSLIFTLEKEKDNAFRNIMLPMAQQDSGLMHSILALSGKHINYDSDYGRHLLAEHPDVDIAHLEERSQYHSQAALKRLYSQTTASKPQTPFYSQMLCLVLEGLSNKEPHGEHRVHLNSYRQLIKEHPPEENSEAMKFIHEFFQYHIQCDQLIHYPENGTYESFTDNFNLPWTIVQPGAVRMLGVFDGLFLYMSQITNLRNQIRYNFDHGVDPVVDYKILIPAAEIDAGIREWEPAWPKGDPRDLAGLLYRHMMWIYLWRSVFPPLTNNWKLDERIIKATNDGIAILSLFDPHDTSQTLILAPAFLIGCACFLEEQREPIRKAIRTVKSYMEYQNTDVALKVLEEVWRLMDAKDERSWDWQAIAKSMNMDFLAT